MYTYIYIYTCFSLSASLGFLLALEGAIDQITIVTLKVSSAVGAAVLGAKAASLSLPVDYRGNTELLEQYSFGRQSKGEEEEEGKEEGEVKEGKRAVGKECDGAEKA